MAISEILDLDDFSIPPTKEDIDNYDPTTAAIMRGFYSEWRDRQRRQDKHDIKVIASRIRYLKSIKALVETTIHIDEDLSVIYKQDIVHHTMTDHFWCKQVHNARTRQ